MLQVFFIKSQILDTVKESALELNFSNFSEVSKSVDKIQTGKVARDEIKTLLKDGKITETDKIEFKEQGRAM